jgi:hypothetical protein
MAKTALYLNMDVTLFGTCSHVIFMTQKVDPRAEGGARILIKESSIKVIEKWQVLEKARLIIFKTRCISILRFQNKKKNARLLLHAFSNSSNNLLTHNIVIIKVSYLLVADTKCKSGHV